MVMPLRLLRAYDRMLPRLTAEESLLAARRASVASGFMPSGTTSAILREWMTQAFGPQPVRPANRAALGDMGLGHRRVKVTRQLPEATS